MNKQNLIVVVVIAIVATLGTGLYIAHQHGAIEFTTALNKAHKDASGMTEKAAITRQVSGTLDIKEIRSEDGLTAWLVQDTSVPVISIHFGFRDAGSATDPVEKQGLARLVSNTMDEGAGNLDAQEFQSELRNNSIRLHFTVDRDHYGGHLQTLSKNKDTAFRLLKLALTDPLFDEEPLERMKAANIARIKSDLSDPAWRALRIAYDVAFEGHPYAKNSGGTISGIQNVTQRDLQRFAKSYLAKDNLVIGISGDISVEDAQSAIDNIFGKLPETSDIPEIPDTGIRNKNESVHHKMDIPQTHIQLWHGGVPRQSENYAEAQILNHIFGRGGFGSRLMTSAREKEGLTYGIYSYLQHFNHADMLIISTSTQNEKAGEMMQIIIQEIQTLSEKGITEEELTAAKDYLSGSLPLRFTSNPRISQTLMSLQLDGLEMDYLDRYLEDIQAASITDVNALTPRLLSLDEFIGVTVGQPGGLDHAPNSVVETLPNVE